MILLFHFKNKKKSTFLWKKAGQQLYITEWPEEYLNET